MIFKGEHYEAQENSACGFVEKIYTQKVYVEIPSAYINLSIKDDLSRLYILHTAWYFSLHKATAPQYPSPESSSTLMEAYGTARHTGNTNC